jgi:hypothetical protein
VKNQKFNIENHKSTKCVYCSSEVRLNEFEMESGTFFCPGCHRENVIWELRQDYIDTMAKSNGNGLIYLVGTVSVLILIYLLPRLAGIF